MEAAGLTKRGRGRQPGRAVPGGRQLVEDVWISVENNLDGGLVLSSIDLASQTPRENEVWLSTVDSPSALLVVPGAVFVGDERGAVACFRLKSV